MRFVGRRWPRLRSVTPAVGVIVAMRLRFLFTPISSDEAGYLAIGRAWGRGAVLYRDVWVDRPQGAILLFRVLAAFGLGTPVGVRLLALAVCLAGAVACGDAAATLAGEHARWTAALLVGVLTSVPQYEGFIADTELLSCAVGAVALAVVLRSTWHRDRPTLRGLALGGCVGGLALSIKQSGFDAFAAAGLAVLVVAARAGWSRRDRRAALPALVGGWLVPIAAMMVHGALTGWRRWWFAVAGYRAAKRSVLANADWHRFHHTYLVVAPVLLPTLAGVAVLIVVVGRRANLGIAALFVGWSIAAVVAFLLGGQFHRHYWVILMFPLGTNAGVLAASMPRRAVRSSVVAAFLVAPAILTVQAVTIPRSEVGRKLDDDPRLIRDERVADWFRAHAGPGDRIYALCASAGLYGNLSIDPPIPYLWFDSLRSLAEAQADLERLISGSDAPRFVAEYQHPASCNPSGRVASALASDYRVTARVDGIPIYERISLNR